MTNQPDSRHCARRRVHASNRRRRLLASRIVRGHWPHKLQFIVSSPLTMFKKWGIVIKYWVKASSHVCQGKSLQAFFC